MMFPAGKGRKAKAVDHSITSRTSPAATVAPSTIGTSLTLPDLGAMIAFSIFMLSRTSKASPAWTLSPTLHLIDSTLPGSGARIAPATASSFCSWRGVSSVEGARSSTTLGRVAGACSGSSRTSSTSTGNVFSPTLTMNLRFKLYPPTGEIRRDLLAIFHAEYGPLSTSGHADTDARS